MTGSRCKKLRQRRNGFGAYCNSTYMTCSKTLSACERETTTVGVRFYWCVCDWAFVFEHGEREPVQETVLNARHQVLRSTSKYKPLQYNRVGKKCATPSGKPTSRPLQRHTHTCHIYHPNHSDQSRHPHVIHCSKDKNVRKTRQETSSKQYFHTGATNPREILIHKANLPSQDRAITAFAFVFAHFTCASPLIPRARLSVCAEASWWYSFLSEV